MGLPHTVAASRVSPVSGNRLRANTILKALTFQGDPGAQRLVNAIEHFKEKDGMVDKSAPTAFLDPEERAAVSKDGKFRVSLYNLPL